MPCYHVDGYDHNADDDDDDNEDDDDHDDKGDDDLMQKEASSRAGEESSIEMCGEAGFEVRTRRASSEDLPSQVPQTLLLVSWGT